ncbi:hypothetical protein [Cellulomonas hominis]
MSEATPLPVALEVRELLESLLGRDVQVTTGGSMVDPAGEGGALLGVYVDKLLRLTAIAVFDLPLAARAGAAIALMPPGSAEAAIEDGMLSPALTENTGEILNITASLFNVGDAPHVKLDAVYAPGDPVPADVAQWVLAYVRRLDLDVTVQGYGPGRLSVLVL